jgi:hypothetical protein
MSERQILALAIARKARTLNVVESRKYSGDSRQELKTSDE